MSLALAAGEEPLGIAMRLPDLAEHGEHRLGQRHDSLFVPLAHDVQEHQLGVNGGNGQADGFAHSQPAGVHGGEAGTIDRMANGGDQRAAVGAAAGVGQTLLPGKTHFFFVNKAQS